jgi:hypothetical protein
VTDDSDIRYLVKGEHCAPFNWIVKANTEWEAEMEIKTLIDEGFFDSQFAIKYLSISKVE